MFSDLTIKNYDDTNRVSAPKVVNLIELSSFLVEEWVPYVDCCKCGRNDYCKYAKKYGANRFEEIKCGVVIQFIKEVCTLTNDDFLTLVEDENSTFLDALYFLVKYCFESESFVGLFQTNNFTQKLYDGTLGSNLLGSVSELREHLNNACKLLQEIPFASSKRVMLLVEGQSERNLIERLRIHNSPYLDRITVESYEGKQNKLKNKIHLLINYFKQKGYRVIIQVDKDGNENLNKTNWFGLIDHIKSGLITEKDIFAFKEDLESAYPREILIHCLCSFGLKRDDILSAFGNLDPEKPLYRNLEKLLDWVPPKPLLAKDMADLISHCNLLHSKDHKENEIAKFFNFASEHSFGI